MASGWDGWCVNFNSQGPNGSAIYCPSSGAIWGRSGEFDCSGSLHLYDQKAKQKDVSPPTVNGVKFMFIREASEGTYLFKSGPNSLVTTKGPSGGRVCLYVKEQKPETPMNAVINYMEKNGCL